MRACQQARWKGAELLNCSTLTLLCDTTLVWWVLAQDDAAKDLLLGATDNPVVVKTAKAALQRRDVRAAAQVLEGVNKFVTALWHAWR